MRERSVQRALAKRDLGFPQDIFTTAGNTQAPCVIIGERMAEILKAA